MVRIFAHELSKHGGSWLGTARTWLQSHVMNGDSVRWGSDDQIIMSVERFEECAAFIAAAATNDERERVERNAKRIHKDFCGAPKGMPCVCAAGNDPIKFTFNTGRQYQRAGHEFAGQVIDVELDPRSGNIVKFWDRSRGIDGFIFYVHVGASQSAIKAALMQAYDHNRYQPLDSLEQILKEQAKEGV